MSSSSSSTKGVDDILWSNRNDLYEIDFLGSDVVLAGDGSHVRDRIKLHNHFTEKELQDMVGTPVKLAHTHKRESDGQDAAEGGPLIGVAKIIPGGKAIAAFSQGKQALDDRLHADHGRINVSFGSENLHFRDDAPIQVAKVPLHIALIQEPPGRKDTWIRKLPPQLPPPSMSFSVCQLFCASYKCV